MILHSIKWRLQAWHGFLLVCLVSGLLSGFYIFERREKMLMLDTDASEDQITNLLRLTERYCVVLQTLKHPPEMELVRKS